ncbi:hypothetical protein GGS20DRAFT_549870 [Poronia punctata]|nr:hypothetical protein GGS20DRAFT_549870 [Poronia punctata]
MCELHTQRCVGCKLVWTKHIKLASCESDDPNARCQISLCMYVGNPRKPVKSECDACRDEREAREEAEEEEEGKKEKGKGKEKG